MKSEMKHREVPTEEATVKYSGAMKKQHRGWQPAARRRTEPHKLTEEIMDPEGSWLLPAERSLVMQQWHGARETSSGKYGPRETVDCERNWTQLTG
jgi:hypothetical protein